MKLDVLVQRRQFAPRMRQPRCAVRRSLRARPRTARRAIEIARPDSLRCSAYEYRLLAQGHADFVISTQMTPWDHAPGALIVEQAGGKAAMIDGTPYSAAITSGALIVASSKDVWSTVAEAFDFLEEIEVA